jgi:hypothetical protein
MPAFNSHVTFDGASAHQHSVGHQLAVISHHHAPRHDSLAALWLFFLLIFLEHNFRNPNPKISILANTTVASKPSWTTTVCSCHTAFHCMDHSSLPWEGKNFNKRRYCIGGNA